MKISILLGALNQLKTDHWQTTSHAEHTALGDAYEALDGLFDKFIEIFYGRKGIPQKNLNVTYSASFEAYNGEMLRQYLKLKGDVMDHLYEVASDANDLKNIADEIEGEFNHLLYRLQQK